MKTRKCVRPRVEELEHRLVPSTLITSMNWSGYIVSTGAGAVSQVAASWAVPAVSSSVSGYSAAWVGIDGYTSATVEQIGTSSDYVNGKANYFAWYEMYPSPSHTLNLTIQPGDTISASVSYGGASQFTLSLTDVTSGKSFSTTQTTAADRSSAEWVEEAPSSGASVLPLANFGTVNFSGANATVAGTAGPTDNSWSGTTLYQVNMVTSSGALKATTSGVTDSGSPATSSFGVTWVSSGGGGKGGKGGGHKSLDAPPAPTGVQLSAALAGLLVNTPTTPSVFTATPTPVAATSPALTTIAAPSASFPHFGALSSGVADANDTADSNDAGAAAQPDNPPPQADQAAAPRSDLYLAQATDASLADGFQPSAIKSASVITEGESESLRLAAAPAQESHDTLAAGFAGLALAGGALGLALERAWASGQLGLDRSLLATAAWRI